MFDPSITFSLFLYQGLHICCGKGGNSWKDCMFGAWKLFPSSKKFPFSCMNWQFGLEQFCWYRHISTCVYLQRGQKRQPSPSRQMTTFLSKSECENLHSGPLKQLPLSQYLQTGFSRISNLFCVFWGWLFWLMFCVLFFCQLWLFMCSLKWALLSAIIWQMLHLNCLTAWFASRCFTRSSFDSDL